MDKDAADKESPDRNAVERSDPERDEQEPSDTDAAEGTTVDLKAQAEMLRSGPPAAPEAAPPARARRGRSTTILLLFVVVLGLPIVGVPALRHRLKTRFDVLADALATPPGVSPPLLARVGENRTPFPKQYRHPEVFAPTYPAVVNITGGGLVAGRGAVTGTPAPAGTEAAPAEERAPASTEPEYRRGKVEQEAYDLVLQSNQAVVALVKGSDPSLEFKSWGVAELETDSYLVKVTMVQTSDQVERDYIWNVKLSSKQVTPLSAYARSLAKP